MIKIKNADKLLKRLNSISDLDVESSVKEATELVHRAAKDLAPADTGLLRESIHMDVTGGAVVTGRVYTNLGYAAFVEFGTGPKGDGTYPYDINGLSLTYTNHSWVYTPDEGDTFRRTNGKEARPYMYPALKHNEKRIKDIFKSDIQKALKGG